MSEELFEKLSLEDQNRLESMVLKKPIQAIKELRHLTDCSLGEANRWVDNKREEISQERKIWHDNLPPCPYCGEKLRTPEARQCRFCKRDWHNENELKCLK